MLSARVVGVVYEAVSREKELWRAVGYRKPDDAAVSITASLARTRGMRKHRTTWTDGAEHAQEKADAGDSLLERAADEATGKRRIKLMDVL